MLKNSVVIFMATLAALFANLGFAGYHTATGYQKSEVLDTEGQYVTFTKEHKGLSVSANLFGDADKGKLHSFGTSANMHIPVFKRISLTPGLGYDYYRDLDKGRFNVNLGANVYVAHTVTFTAAIKEDFSKLGDSGTSYQFGLSKAW